jgi:hypothetical protein
LKTRKKNTIREGESIHFSLDGSISIFWAGMNHRKEQETCVKKDENKSKPNLLNAVNKQNWRRDKSADVLCTDTCSFLYYLFLRTGMVLWEKARKKNNEKEGVWLSETKVNSEKNKTLYIGGLKLIMNYCSLLEEFKTVVRLVLCVRIEESSSGPELEKWNKNGCLVNHLILSEGDDFVVR